MKRKEKIDETRVHALIAELTDEVLGEPIYNDDFTARDLFQEAICEVVAKHSTLTI